MKTTSTLPGLREIEEVNQHYREMLPEYIANKELAKSNNKGIKEDDIVETKGFGRCVVTEVRGDLITVELEDGTKRTCMNNPKFVWVA